MRLGIGSFLEEYQNRVEIVTLDEDTGRFVSDPRLRFDHPYPCTKLMFAPDKECQHEDLMATTGDFLRIWKIDDDDDGSTAEKEKEKEEENENENENENAVERPIGINYIRMNYRSRASFAALASPISTSRLRASSSASSRSNSFALASSDCGASNRILGGPILAHHTSKQFLNTLPVLNGFVRQPCASLKFSYVV